MPSKGAPILPSSIAFDNHAVSSSGSASLGSHLLASARGRGGPAKDGVVLCSLLPTYRAIVAMRDKSTPGGGAQSVLRSGRRRLGERTTTVWLTFALCEHVQPQSRPGHSPACSCPDLETAHSAAFGHSLTAGHLTAAGAAPRRQYSPPLTQREIKVVRATIAPALAFWENRIVQKTRTDAASKPRRAPTT
jgi:hypothetical protein